MISLPNGEFSRHTYNLFVSGGRVQMEPIEGETKMLLSHGPLAILDFNSGLTIFDWAKYINEYDNWCGEVIWNPDHSLILLAARSKSNKSDELWLLNSDFRIVDKVVNTTELYRTYRRTHKIEHQYAWALEQYWEHWNRAKVQPDKATFSHKTHTIEYKRISPADAASVW